jgi:RNA polymerase sigma-70 factor (ECF subfamily)
MNKSDRQIMDSVIGGQIELFDELVRRHRTSMLRAAESKFRNRSQAEDAVQDCFLSAFARRHTFNPKYSFRGWLWTILLNVCRTQFRREARHATQSLSYEALAANEPATPETGLSELLRAERSEFLADLLDQIPDFEADALRLRFFGELQFDEISQAMNCSLSGAKTRVRRGLERLAELARRDSLCAHDGDDHEL